MDIYDFDYEVDELYREDKKGRRYDGYTYKARFGEQYVIVDFLSDNPFNSKTIHWAIGLTISDYEDNEYCKKIHKQKLVTGRIGAKGLLFAKAAVQYFETTLCEYYPNHKNFLYCEWTDKRRRKVYSYALKKLGYKYGLRKFRPCLRKEIIL